MSRVTALALALVLLAARPVVARRSLFEAQQEQQPQPDQGPDCPGAEKWFPECWALAQARIAAGNDRTLYWTPFTSERWGNALSGYWFARALALLAGYGFDAYVGFDGPSWLSWLPRKVPPSTCPDPAAFKAACSTCEGDAWEHPHRCGAAWPAARGLIRNATREAFMGWAEQRGKSFPAPRLGDVVIQARCANDTLLSHPEYGPVAFSYYTTNIDPKSTKRIQIVSEARASDGLCQAIHRARAAALAAAFPAAEVSGVGAGRAQDFARMLLAPVLFRDSQSSFGLWAGVASEGEVFSVPLLERFTSNTKPDLGPGWHWVDAPVLYPSVAEAANITCSDPAALIAWLQAY